MRRGEIAKYSTLSLKRGIKNTSFEKKQEQMQERESLKVLVHS